MKKRVFVFAVLAMMLFGALTAQAELTTEERCTMAIDMLKNVWKNDVLTDDSDGYFEVAHTRVIYLFTESSDENKAKYLQQYFTNDNGAAMEAFVECTLFTDYFSSAPYYSDVMLYHCVAFYEDGTEQVLSKSPVEIFRARSFETRYDGIIREIADLDGKYNEICYLK